MKKITKKLKGKKVLSFVLAAIMLATTFNIALPMLKLNAGAENITIDGVSQTQIVTDTTVYDTYAANYLNGAGHSTGIVIPGLDPSEDYIIQGMTYYPGRDWMLVTAYHNDGTASSKVFALDAATGEFVAMFSFLNLDGSENMDHAGGIAISEHNIYYSCDADRKIAYAPISWLDNAKEGEHTKIQLVAEADFVEVGSISYDSKTAYTAYVCYDQGILWMGNFYDLGAKLLGVTIAADDYNAPANNTYNSMVFGYKLSGSTSEEEWNNLISGTADCKGNPSYAIGLSNTLKDVQYAVVDNGKLYLSRSYGSGAGNSINFGFGETSFLTVADIDLSVPGDTPITISTTETGSLDKEIMAYDISDYDDYTMMPMSEGLCVVDGDIFITFEGASNKYLNESSGLTSIGNCEKPVDVVWQLDPYELMEIAVAEPEKSICYRKVNSFDEIEDGKEYIIVHESTEKDPVTQENILYALNADGNFKNYKLSKSSASDVKGYNGMIGHAISDYDLIDEDDDGVNDILYLNDPDNDDVKNVRWTLTNVSGNNYRIASTEIYFANCNNLYFDKDKISMMPSGSSYLNNIKLQESGNGKGGFWLSNAEKYFLWSNDGGYNDKINEYYSEKSGTTSIYDGISEQKGTFHCDALDFNGEFTGNTPQNIIGGTVETGADTFYADGVFYIYKRIVDDVASTYESRVYTNLGAELQEDGTYTVELETYAISPNHYQYRGVKPTDYIIVADTSNSMESTGSTGIVAFNGNLAVSSLCTEAATSDDNGEGVNGYNFSNATEDIYYKHTDGNYYKIYLAVSTTDHWEGIFTHKFYQYYWAYYIADDGLYYVLQTEGIEGGVAGGVWPGITPSEFKANVAAQTTFSTYTADQQNADRQKLVVYTGPHYRFDDVSSQYTNEHTRISTLKNALSNLVGQIAAENSENRIALVQFGADASTGFYNTSSTLSTTDYTNAFWSVSNASSLQTIINNIKTSTQTSNEGIEFKYVNEIMANSGVDYKGGDSERNVAVIFLSDGVAGADDQSYTTIAADKVIARALDAKRSGAFVYTVMLGADGTTFNRKLYMDAVSSKYAEATSMTDLGGQNIDGVTYTLSLATTTMDNYINFGHVALEEISTNNAVGLENLDANAYLREQFSEAFKFPTDSAYDVKVELVPGVFDKIGRFTFDESNAVEQSNADDANDSDVDWIVDASNRIVTVTNYNYGEQYIGKNRTTPGNKLKITITGLLANEKATIQNTSINDTATTGIYKSETSEKAFKYFPTEYFNIPEYTYVLDYGLQMLDTDVNGTLKSVSADLSAQRDANGNLAYKTVSGNGLVTIQDGAENLLYHTTPTNTTDSGYVLIQRDSGKYDWFEIKVVPASNVYFEETEFAKDAGTGTVAWETTTGGTSATHRGLPGENDVVGYDAAYDNTNTYSNGTAFVASVDSTNKRSKTATVTFAGSGIDIISACGPTTGMQIINIKDASTGKSVAASIVDTYYADTTFSQVPVFSWRGNYGEYTVETTAVYLSTAGALKKSGFKSSLIDTGLVMNTADDLNTPNVQAMLDAAGVEDIDAENLELVWFDDNSVLNGGTGVAPTKKGARAGETTSITLNNYIDGFRIYNPLGSNHSTDYEASEQGSMYYNVIDSLADGSLSPDGSLDGTVAFVTGELAEGETLNFANYESIGPKNELYLNGNATNGVTFKTPFVDGIKVMVSLRAVNGATTVNINGKEFAVKSATEMYYDITDLLTEEEGSKATVSIINSGSGILAVNNIKLTNTVSAASLMPLSAEDIGTVQHYATMEPVQATVENGVVTPVVDEEVPEDNTNTDTETEGSGIFSFVKMLIAFIEKILSSSFGTGNIF